MSAGFGGGMGIEDKCGVLTASIMVLGNLFVQERAHESGKIKELVRELFSSYAEQMGDIDCAPLKERHYSEDQKCQSIIIKAGELLDEIVTRERSKNNNFNQE